jgi:hypothetical protein
MRCVPWLAMLLVLTAGCGGDDAVCTMIGSPAGLGLEIPASAGFSRATLETCWRGQCVKTPLDLGPATGERRSFVDLPTLPAEPVRVTAWFDDGKPHTTEVTPAFTEPNGPDCGRGGPQAQLVAGTDGELRPR